MSGLRSYVRDAAPLAACGDDGLAPPGEKELLELVRTTLARPGAPSPLSARWVYARWKPGLSLTAGYELDYADGAQRFVAWKRYTGPKAADLGGRREHTIAPEVADDRLLGHALLPESGAHLWAPPFDRELPGLERGFDLRRMKRWFLDQGLFAGRAVRSGSSRSHLVRYKPERRAVLRLDLRLRPVEGGPKSAEQLGARALPPAEAERVARARRAWQSCRAAQVAPRFVACEERAGLIYEEWLAVDPCARDAFELAREAGLLLARVHVERAPQIAAAEPHSLRSSLDLMATQPELRSRSRTLAVPAREAPGAPSWIHGDFHPDQLARSREDGSLRLLDLDRLGPGRPLDDVASWVADHLAERAEDDLRTAGREFLDGYCAGGGSRPSSEDLATAVAEALVQRAAGALRRLESGAAAKAAHLLDRARELAPKGALFA